METGTNTWDISQDELREIPQFLGLFLRHPVERIRNVPTLQWPTILLLWTGLLMISGAVSGLFTRKLGDFLAGLIIFPLSGVCMAAIATAFFYWTFQLFLQRDIPFRRLYLVVVLASIPYLILRIIIPVAPPADVFGLAFSAALMVVGCVDNFQLPRQFVMRMMAGVFAVFLVFWIASMLQSLQFQMRPKMEKVTPDSFERLEQELKQSDQ